MCREDLKLGNMKYSRLSTAPAGSNTTLKADSSRVHIKFTGIGDVGTGVGAWVSHASTGVTIASMRSGRGFDDLDIETHGAIVKEAMIINVIVGTSPIGVLEVLLSDPVNSPPFDLDKK